MKNKSITTTEPVLYIIYGLIALGGLTLIVLHFISINLSNLQNALIVANDNFAETMKMNWLIFGTLLILVAAIASAITLSSVGSKIEQSEERKARRQQRLSLEEIKPEE